MTKVSQPSRAWLLLRRPLFLGLALGCCVSALSSGRFSVRLVADGAVSFAFVPAFVLLAFAIVYRRAGAQLPFAAAADRFFLVNTPWLVWMLIVATAGCLAQPPALYDWFVPLVGLGIVAAAWSIVVDLRFFQDTLQRTRREALRDVTLQRAISWTAAGVYFFGIAAWPDVVTMLARAAR